MTTAAPHEGPSAGDDGKAVEPGKAWPQACSQPEREEVLDALWDRGSYAYFRQHAGPHELWREAVAIEPSRYVTVSALTRAPAHFRHYLRLRKAGMPHDEWAYLLGKATEQRVADYEVLRGSGLGHYESWEAKERGWRLLGLSDGVPIEELEEAMDAGIVFELYVPARRAGATHEELMTGPGVLELHPAAYAEARAKGALHDEVAAAAASDHFATWSWCLANGAGARLATALVASHASRLFGESAEDAQLAMTLLIQRGVEPRRAAESVAGLYDLLKTVSVPELVDVAEQCLVAPAPVQ